MPQPTPGELAPEPLSAVTRQTQAGLDRHLLECEENRRIDLSASPEVVGKRLAEAKKIFIVLTEASVASLMNAYDILVPILQFAQLTLLGDHSKGAYGSWSKI